jgi:hypothetical protein
MSDDSAARRDAWRNAQTATTVTGDRVHDRVPPREHEGEDIHLPDTAQVPKPTESGRRNTLTRADGQFADHDPVDQPVDPNRHEDPDEHAEAMRRSAQYRLQTEGVFRPTNVYENDPEVVERITIAIIRLIEAGHTFDNVWKTEDTFTVTIDGETVGEWSRPQNATDARIVDEEAANAIDDWLDRNDVPVIEEAAAEGEPATEEAS